MACLVMGIQMMSRERLSAATGLNRSQRDTLAADWYRLSQDAQEASDWLQVPDIQSLQAIV